MVTRRGGALLAVLALLLVVQGLVALLFVGTGGRLAAATDQRQALEAQLLARAILAEGRMHFATGAVLPEGAPMVLRGERPVGWRWSVTALRRGDLVRLRAEVERRTPGGVPLAGGRATLLLHRLPSDTLQRLNSRARF